MNSDKVRMFIELAGQFPADTFRVGDEAQRSLGAQLLLSEVLEYIVHGLGLTPIVNGVAVHDPNDLRFAPREEQPNPVEMLDGLADVAYTMYWNALTFGIPLEEGFDLVCDNNLSKFVSVDSTARDLGSLESSEWHCGKDVEWPTEVVEVRIVEVSQRRYAVGKDASGKVRKPSSYRPVDLQELVSSHIA